MNTRRSLPLTLLLALALLALILLAVSPPTAHAKFAVLRVTMTGSTSDPACGGSWGTACGLQYALTTIASSGVELWVAAGTYTPTTDADPTISFQLKSGVALYGGFAGGETLRIQRNFMANVTILSGAISSSCYSYHVVTGSGVTNTAVLDGFTVTGGTASALSSPHDVGGGMYSNGGSPTLKNVTFSDNLATAGGGMYNENSSNPTLSSVTFISNWAMAGGGMFNDNKSSPALTNVTFVRNIGGGMDNNLYSNPSLTNVTFISNTAAGYGGGMANYNTSSPTLMNVAFVSNTASDYGGGMYNRNSNPTLTNVTFSGNSASYDGGGMYNESSNPTLTNVTFSANSAAVSGGAMHNDNGSSPTLTNVTLSGNWAGNTGGAMFNYLAISPTITNTIIWGNSAPNSPQISDFPPGSIVLIDHSVVQGGYTGGTQIITADPRLGPLGYWGGATQTVPLLPGSSAIDAGDDTHCPATDQRGVPRPQGAHCDIGAIEAQLTLINLPLISR